MIKKIKNKIIGLTGRVKRCVYLFPRQAAYNFFYTKKIENYEKLSCKEKKLLKEPWYHDFSFFGIRTVQEPGIWKANQQCKEKPLFAYIEQAIAWCRGNGMAGQGIELFCADGYYGIYAVQCGAEAVHGLDLDEKNLAKAELMSKLLGRSEKTHFEKRDVFTMDRGYDFGICAGGLYHISDPAGLLKMLSQKVRGSLVIQTVYSLANDSKDYFETPAPGWTWGCRFSYDYLKRMIENAGWAILSETKNELLGNKRLEDRGSAYFLCTIKMKG
jgi:hypothetical protein